MAARRLSPRWPAGWPARYRIVGASARWNECRVVDASLAGAALALGGDAADHPIGEQAVLEFELADAPPGIRLHGAVRNRTADADGTVRAGIEFVDLSTAERAALHFLLSLRSRD